MKKLYLMLLALVVSASALASGGHELEPANIDLSDKEALQRGAKYFVNYCQGCHSAQYFRYESMQEFGIRASDIRANLITTGANLGDQMKIAMPEADAAGWFGAAPPDLTLVTRRRHGHADWLYAYLKGFYIDESRPMGVNNLVFPNVGMPHVLWELQGIQKAVKKELQTGEGNTEEVIDHLELVEPGKLSEKEYDRLAKDLATFLAYVSEPVKLERQRIGVWVMLFLVVFMVLAYRMKKEFWKDIH